MTDEEWLDSLRNATNGEGAQIDGFDAALVRAAISEWHSAEMASGDDNNQQALERLLFRLRREGLLHSNHTKPNRSKTKQWMALAASVAVVVIAIGVLMPRPTELGDDDNATLARGVEERQIIESADPQKTLTQLVAAFDKLHVQYTVTARGTGFVVDGVVSADAADSLHDLFEALKIKPDSNGLLMIEIRKGN